MSAQTPHLGLDFYVFGILPLRLLQHPLLICKLGHVYIRCQGRGARRLLCSGQLDFRALPEKADSHRLNPLPAILAGMPCLARHQSEIIQGQAHPLFPSLPVIVFPVVCHVAISPGLAPAQQKYISVKIG